MPNTDCMIGLVNNLQIVSIHINYEHKNIDRPLNRFILEAFFLVLIMRNNQAKSSPIKFE